MFPNSFKDAFDSRNGRQMMIPIVCSDHNGHKFRIYQLKNTAFFNDPEGVLSTIPAAAEVENMIGLDIFFLPPMLNHHL